MKTPSSVEGIFLVGPAGGKLRPWCGHCHKFLKSETAPHDCTPVDFSKVRSSRKTSGAGKRRIRLTDKTRSILSKIFKAAAIGECLVKKVAKLQSLSKAKKPSIKTIKKVLSKIEGDHSAEKRAARLIKKFL